MNVNNLYGQRLYYGFLPDATAQSATVHGVKVYYDVTITYSASGDPNYTAINYGPTLCYCVFNHIISLSSISLTIRNAHLILQIEPIQMWKYPT